MLLLFKTAVSSLEQDPYNWEILPADNSGVSARRKQEGTYIYLHADTKTNLLARCQEYEDFLASRSIPVSPEWGQLWGTSASQRRRLLSI